LDARLVERRRLALTVVRWCRRLSGRRRGCILRCLRRCRPIDLLCSDDPPQDDAETHPGNGVRNGI
jgi:hypothetical protein